MSRDVPYCEDEICDDCGKLGAFDFMGDLICGDCMEKEDNSEPQKKGVSAAVEEFDRLNKQKHINDHVIADMTSVDVLELIGLKVRELAYYTCADGHKDRMLVIIDKVNIKFDKSKPWFHIHVASIENGRRTGHNYTTNLRILQEYPDSEKLEPCDPNDMEFQKARRNLQKILG